MNSRYVLFTAVWMMTAASLHAAGLESPPENLPQRLVEWSYNEDVAPTDPRVKKTGELLATAMKRTGETDQAVAQVCLRNAKYIFDFSRQRTTAIEVLEAIAQHAPDGKPINETSQRYFDLRVKQKLDHAAAMAKLAGR